VAVIDPRSKSPGEVYEELRWAAIMLGASLSAEKLNELTFERGA
jgi:hypothetical protein